MKLPVFGTVGTTFVFGLRHFPAFYLLLCLLAGLPRSLHSLISGQSLEDARLSAGSWQQDLLMGLEVLLMGFVTAVMVWTLIRDRQGERWTVVAAMGDAAQRLPSVLSVGACFAIAMTLYTVVAGGLVEVALLAAVPPFLLLIVLVVVFAVAMPCAAVEDVGVMECFRKAASLTAGSRLRILALYFLVVIPLVIVFVAIVVVSVMFILPAGRMDGLPAVWGFLAAPAFSVFLAAASVAIHEQLAELGDGIVLGETAAVFD